MRALVGLVLGDDVSTDIIYPGRFMATVLPDETPQFAFADSNDFNKKIRDKNVEKPIIVVAGKNFGCGSSREQAVSCLLGARIIVIAQSFARIFFNNAINLGLPVYICKNWEAKEEDEIEILGDYIKNHTQQKAFQVEKISISKKSILDAGGLIPYTQKRLIFK